MHDLDLKIPLTLALLLFVSGAFAQETTRWARVDGWSVRIDNTVGYGCYIHAQYDSGTNLRLGYDPQASNVYLILGNPAWRSLKNGKKYDLVLQFDNLAPWRIEATGVPVGVMSALAFELSDQDFIRAFMEHHVLTMSYRNSVIDRLTLSGSLKAVQEMIRCQKQIEQADKPDERRKQDLPDTPKDSFSPNPSRDPFI